MMRALWGMLVRLGGFVSGWQEPASRVAQPFVPPRTEMAEWLAAQRRRADRDTALFYAKHRHKARARKGPRRDLRGR